MADNILYVVFVTGPFFAAIAALYSWHWLLINKLSLIVPSRWVRLLVTGIGYTIHYLSFLVLIVVASIFILSIIEYVGYDSPRGMIGIAVLFISFMTVPASFIIGLLISLFSDFIDWPKKIPIIPPSLKGTIRSFILYVVFLPGMLLLLYIILIPYLNI